MASRWPNMHLLCDDVVCIEGQRFVGSTLWASPAASAKDYHINVTEPGDRAMGRVMGSMNKGCKQFLNTMTRPGDVVVTHFMPMMPDDVRALAPYRFSGCDHDDYFGNVGLDPAMARARLWISGHTHSAFDVTPPGKCRWVCNPLGHNFEETGGDFEGVVVDLK